MDNDKQEKTGIREDGYEDGEQKLSIEEAFLRLEGILSRMENETNSLEETFLLYQQGVGLIDYCSRSIDRVEKAMLVLDEGGEDFEFF